MEFTRLFEQNRHAVDINQLLKNQLLWMMLLRLVLYSLLLTLSMVFQASDFDTVPIPSNVIFFLVLLVYLSTIFSAGFLLLYPGNARQFGFSQVFLDTVFVSLLVFFSGASHSNLTSVFFFPIIAGGLILPKKGGLIAAAAATFQYALLLYLELYGLYPSYLAEYLVFGPTSTMISLNRFSVHGLIFFLAAILSALFGMRLQKAETALSDSLESFDQLAILYKQIFDNITTGIITIDHHLEITSANNAIGHITGLDTNTLIAKNLSAVFHSIDLSTENIRQTFDFFKADGTKVRVGYSHMSLTNTELKQPQKNRPHKIITLRDISELEKLEQQVRQTEKLAAIGMMSASIAHDFRNPLTVISGSAQVLSNEFTDLPGSGAGTNLELCNIILRETNRLTETIGDFLKFSRPDHASCEWVSLKNCIEEVLQMLRAGPKWPHSAEIILNFDEKIALWADEKQIFTVLSHLIQNAIPFCPAGYEKITISADELSGDEGDDWLELSVEDNGTGIQQNDFEMIFEPFFTKRPDGTGLGLAIVKQTIEAHKGTIAVNNGNEKGAIFTIMLPLPR